MSKLCIVKEGAVAAEGGILFSVTSAYRESIERE